MTIRRQYSLPNCTLILDGVSNGSSTDGIPDPRPLMSSLFNAECHFVGYKQTLCGGKDFLTSLISVVSNYTQEFLSGVPHPGSPTLETTSLVSLTKGDRENVHYLEAILDPSGNSTADGKPTQIKLSTVQLFDLLESIDRFLADRRTLPDIMVPLKPLAKALAQPISTQRTPAGLGLASLVVASLIGYALPAPKVSAPKFIPPAAVSTQTTPSPPNKNTTEPAKVPPESTSKPQPSPSTDPVPPSTPPSKTGKITEATQIGFLERKLRRDLNQNWQDRGQIKQATTFQVGVNQDGQIVSYQPVEKTDKSAVNLTPLAKLAIPSTNPNQAVGNFNVVFKPSGSLEIAPEQPPQGEMSLGKQIAEPTVTQPLAQQLKTGLQRSALKQKKTTYSQNLNYRVAVTKTGEIVDYEPTNQLASDYEIETPLPRLTKFNAQAAISQDPLAQYNVIFQPNGKIEVTPK
jgi:Domain of unknown function (DUF4335)